MCVCVCVCVRACVCVCMYVKGGGLGLPDFFPVYSTKLVYVAVYSLLAHVKWWKVEVLYVYFLPSWPSLSNNAGFKTSLLEVWE